MRKLYSSLRAQGLVIAVLFLVSPPLRATDFALPPKYRPKWLTLTAQSQYFTSDANYDSGGGSFEKLGSGRNYQNLTTWLGAHYSFRPRWSVFGSAGFAFAQSSNTDFDRTNSELTEIRVGSQYIQKARPYWFVPELFLVVPLNSFDSSTDKVLTGEGAFALQGGAWFEKKMWGVNPYAYLGLRWQNDGRATLLPFRLGVYRPSSEGISFGGSLEGFVSVIDDQYVNNPSRRAIVTNRVSGRSLRYYGVNPSLYEARGWVGLNFNPQMNVQLAVGQTINGASSAAGTTILALFNWKMDTKKWKKAVLGSKPRSALDRFEIEAPEDYDESLFEGGSDPALDELPPPPAPPKRKRRPVRSPYDN